MADEIIKKPVNEIGKVAYNNGLVLGVQGGKAVTFGVNEEGGLVTTDEALLKTDKIPNENLTFGEVKEGDNNVVSGGQVSNIEAKYRDVVGFYDKVESITDNLVFYNGYMKNSDGTIVNSDKAKTSDFIDIKPSSSIFFKGSSHINEGNPTAVGFDSNGIFVAVLHPNTVSNSQYVEIKTSISISKVRVTFSNNTIEKSLLVFSKSKVIVDNNVVKTNTQLYNNVGIKTSDFYSNGVYYGYYISNITGELNRSNGWAVANICVSNVLTKKICIRINTDGVKFYRLIDKDGNLISFKRIDKNDFFLELNDNAYSLQITIKTNNDDYSVLKNIIINEGDKIIENQEQSFDENLGENVNYFMFNRKKESSKTVSSWGDSITANGIERDLVGYQVLLQRYFKFKNYKTFGFKGYGLSTDINNVNGNSIVEKFINESDISDIYTLFASTNDFRLNKRLGTFEDYLSLESYKKEDGSIKSMNFYESLKAFILKCYEMNKEADIVLYTPLQRNNDGYTSVSKNEKGDTLGDYANAIRKVAEYESLYLIDLFKSSGINMNNIKTYTIDGLHPNNIGYSKIFNNSIPEFKKIIYTYM